MNIVIAIDSLKGSLTSLEAGHAIAEGIRRVDPAVTLTVKPLADGGEGTVEALTYGKTCIAEKNMVTGPLGSPVLCEYHRIPDTKSAIIEMAGAAGLPWFRKRNAIPCTPPHMAWAKPSGTPSKRDAETLSSASAAAPPMTAESGMLQALGYEFLTADRKKCSPRCPGTLRPQGHKDGSRHSPSERMPLPVSLLM